MGGGVVKETIKTLGIMLGVSIGDYLAKFRKEKK
jgi:hypothetical protein